MIEVVSAVIIRNGRILLTQRRPDKDFAFTWECPGGKVDGNESHHQALARELYEELGAETHSIGMTPIWCDEFNIAQRAGCNDILLLMYRVQIAEDGSPEPHPREGQGIGWFTAGEMRKLTLAPGNQRALEAIYRTVNAAGMELLSERPRE